MTNYELLAPAGNLDKLKVALLYGADACFVGGKQFSLRANANNFSDEDLIKAVKFAHSLHKKIHVTVNIIPSDKEIEEAKKYLKFLDSIHVDAIIVSSLALMKYVLDEKLNLEVHVSTQCSTSNHLAVNFYESIGVKRVVLARECSLKEIKEIISNSNVEIETFVHGGLCSSISGRCRLSDFYTGRRANKGECAHSCRWDYVLDNNQSFVFGCKDLCVFPFFKNLLDAKINSFKIEGRMKSIHYIASVVRAYRYYIDSYLKGNLNDEVLKFCYNELSCCESRNYGTSFYKGKVLKEDMIQVNAKEANNTFAGYIKIENNQIILYPKSLINVGDKFDLIVPSNITIKRIKLVKLFNFKNEEILDTRHDVNGAVAQFDCDIVENYSILRRI